MRQFLPWFLTLVAVAACTVAPVRRVATLDPSAPVGHVEGERFTGVRIPVTLSGAGTGWEVSTRYPPFLLEQGYEREGLEQSQVFVFNAATRSSLQVGLSPAGPYDTFSQEKIEWLTRLMGGSMADELDAEFGRGGYTLTLGETTPARLQGVPFAARSFARYEARGRTTENGWIYAFAEPFQIFLLYQLEDPDGGGDREALERILATFRYLGPPAP